MPLLHALAALALLLQGGAEARAAAPPAAVSSGDELARRVDALAAERLAQPGAVGLSIAVARGGEVLLARGYGLAELEFRAPADEHTCFRIASLTKQFTAALVMRRVERGELSLADELGARVPSFPLQGRKVTLEQLLAHTSGIPNITRAGPEWRRSTPLELSGDELLAFVAGKPFDFEPGQAFAYSNTGYYLLGMVLERSSGKSYAELVEEELARPLGLARTRYDSNAEVIEDRAQGYALAAPPGGSERRLVHDQPMGASQGGGAAGLLSTAGDLVRWFHALASGAVVTPASFERMRTPNALPDGSSTGYGFGLAVERLDGEELVLHAGNMPGFTSVLAWHPASDLCVAVLSNSEDLKAPAVGEDVLRAALASGREPQGR
jgi:CubicO group peptidase (beta-lactamase class C family)